MAAAKKDKGNIRRFIKKPKVRRRGIHAKKKQSSNKHSKLYKKVYNSQGR